MIDSGEIDKVGGLKIFGYDISHQTIEPRAQGGSVQAGKPYVVGEEGPEVIIPRSDGNVLSNDDSQIYAMLLASNPQLQKVSKARAEKIMKSRFPEYFE
jgi:SLT domain-containing protein